MFRKHILKMRHKQPGVIKLNANFTSTIYLLMTDRSIKFSK